LTRNVGCVPARGTAPAQNGEIIFVAFEKRGFGRAGDNSLPMQSLFDSDARYDGTVFAFLSSQGDNTRDDNI